MLLHCVYTSRPQTDTQRDRGTDTADGWVVRSVGDEAATLTAQFPLAFSAVRFCYSLFCGNFNEKNIKNKKTVFWRSDRCGRAPGGTGDQSAWGDGSSAAASGAALGHCLGHVSLKCRVGELCAACIILVRPIMLFDA